MKWFGSIAAVLAVVMLINMPAIPMVITAKAVSEPTASRRMTREDFQGEKFDHEGYGQMIAARDAVLTGAETRSSSPVRILRTPDRYALGMPTVYPVGEGAGYAGGITSAAIDGVRTAIALIEKYKP
jgi:hypothetical protein